MTGYRIVAFAALTSLLIPQIVHAECLIPPYKASFEVKAIGIDTGQSHETATRTGDRFELVTQADAHVLFYHRNEVEKSVGVIKGTRIEPQEYSWKIVGGGEGKVEVKQGRLDTLTIGLQLRVDLSKGNLPKTVSVTDGNDDTRSATVELLPNTRKLSTKIGDFEVHVVKLTGLPLIREMWFDAADGHRLVRIMVRDPAVGAVRITITEWKRTLILAATAHAAAAAARLPQQAKEQQSSHMHEHHALG